MEYWWYDYYKTVSEDEYFLEAYNSPAYGSTYDSFVSMCRYNKVEVIEYLVAYTRYYRRIEEENPYYLCPLLLKSTVTGKKFVGYFVGRQVKEIHDYDIEYLVI